MAKGAKAQIKKKKWVSINAPKLFNEQHIGQSYVGEAEDLVGRKVTVSLMTLTNDPQKQNVHVTFNIVGIKEGIATTKLTGYKLLPSSTKKLMRRNKSKIEDSFIVETKDKQLLRVKPLMVTRNRASAHLLSSMRKLMKAFIAKTISQTDFTTFVTDVVQKRVQRSLSQMMKRLYPVSISEIRQMELIPTEKIKELGLKITLPPDSLPEVPKKESAIEKPQAEQAA